MLAYATVFVSDYSYLAVFLFLFSLSFALPISEEVALLTIGYLTRQGLINFPYSLIVSFLGILAGDLFLFFLGRFAGEFILNSKIFKKLFKKENIEKGKLFIKDNGPRVVFISRFVLGVRATTMVASGTLKMKTRVFIIFDFLAMLIFLPLLEFIGYFLAENLDSSISIVNKVGIIILVVFIIGVLVFALKSYWKNKFDHA